MNLLSSVVITVGFFSIDAKYGFDTSLRKTITKQIVAKALNETHDTQNYLRKIKVRHLILSSAETETVVLTASNKKVPHILLP